MLSRKQICEKWLNDKTVNPRTGRKIEKNGPTYMKLEQECITTIVESPERNSLLEKYKEHCSDDKDPISYEPFNEMPIKQLKHIIQLGSGSKKHCYDVGSLYEWITSGNSNPLNPLTGAPFSASDIKKIKDAYNLKIADDEPEYDEVPSRPILDRRANLKKEAIRLIKTGRFSASNGGGDAREYLENVRSMSQEEMEEEFNHPQAYNHYITWRLLHGYTD